MPRLRLVPDGDAEDDSQPVMVPRNDKAIVPIAAGRITRLREHLSAVLSAAGDTASPEGPSSAAPQGFDARVAQTACSLCRGWCCRNGDDTAFLDRQTLARVRRARPGMTAGAILELYRERVPQAGYSRSCIFHGTDGCTLDRALRSDVCNSYFCGGLHSYLRSEDRRAPVVVIAGEGNAMRTSSPLIPSAVTDEITGHEINSENTRRLGRQSARGHKQRRA
jgi:hypothetical protein